MKAEITFDVEMYEFMSVVEGCYRLSDNIWCVFIFFAWSNDDDFIGVKKNLVWDSGVTGLNVFLPEGTNLNKALVLETLSRELGVTEWVEVRGPDSIDIR